MLAAQGVITREEAVMRVEPASLDQLLHPIIANLTNHTPVLMLLILVSVAALMVPLHYKLEKWTKYKLTEKNRQIRLTKAKKIIEELDHVPEKKRTEKVLTE